MFLKLNIDHIKFTGTYLENKFKNIVFKAKLDILNLTITQATKNINHLLKIESGYTEKIRTRLTQEIFDNFIKHEKQRIDKLFKKIKGKQQKKLKNLTNTNTVPNNTSSSTLNWLENISDTQIPENVAHTLSYGPDFCLNITQEKSLPVTEYITSIESAIHSKDNETKDTIRAEVTNLITNHKLKIRHKKFKNNRTQTKIEKHLNHTKKFLKDNTQIVILKPDKSNKTVIMNKTDYETKMEALLNDTITYKKINNDPTNIFQNKNNTFVKKLLNKKEINEVQAKQLSIHNAVPPKLYGLPKLHKPNVPMRPIVSYIKSPFYKLSKYLSNCLSNITRKNNYYIKDSFSFKQFIDTVDLPDDYKLLSLDVVSLYTNIPNDLVQSIISEKWDFIEKHTTMSKESFLEAIDLTLNLNYFQYKDYFVRQLDGCAMGSPISSTIAQLVMEYLEEKVLENLNFNIPFFKRFVDDCLVAVPNNKTQEILQAFNNFHKKLQFTSEIEINNKINFLDMTLERNENKILTKWYTKPTWSGRYQNFHSNHSKNQKLSVIIGLTDRAISLTSPQFRPEILKKVKESLIQNNFNLTDINRIIKRRTYKFYNKQTSNQNTQDNTPKQYVSIPYTYELSEKIKYTLKKYDIVVCHKSHNKLNSLFTKLKSETPTMKNSNVVYSIPCENCPKKYIGMTTQLLKNRLNGHKYTKNATTALDKHLKDTHHSFAFNNTSILNKDENYHKLLIKEMIEIKKEKNAVNDRTDIKGLSQMYNNLIK